jgi:arsenic resistance protein ArsH
MPAACVHPPTTIGVVDVMKELFKITLLMRGRTDYLTDRYSERNERARKAIARQIDTL